MNSHWHIYRSVLAKKFVIYLYSAAAGCHWVISPTVLSCIRLGWNIKQPPDSKLCISSHLALPRSRFVSLWLYIYIYQTQEPTFSVLSRPGVSWFWFIIFTTVSSLRAPGRDGGIAAIYGGDCWRKMYALFDFASSQHLVLICSALASAILSIIYHLMKRIGLFVGDAQGGGWIFMGGYAFSSYPPNMIFWLHFLRLWGTWSSYSFLICVSLPAAAY